MGRLLLVATLAALLGAALWFAASAWLTLQGPDMPASGYIAMALGILFAVVIGCGLMALMFYSSRYGYDDQAGGPADEP
jgi:hypothetical protein